MTSRLLGAAILGACIGACGDADTYNPDGTACEVDDDCDEGFACDEGSCLFLAGSVGGGGAGGTGEGGAEYGSGNPFGGRGAGEMDCTDPSCGYSATENPLDASVDGAAGAEDGGVDAGIDGGS